MTVPNGLIIQGLGLELIQGEMCLVLQNGLLNELPRLSSAYSGWDLSLSQQLQNEQLEPMHLEQPAGFFPGHRRSMINLPKEMYPCISTMAYQSSRNAAEDGDQYEGNQVTVYIEGIVKGETEGEVNRAVQRYAEACHNVLVDSRTINNCVSSVPPPTVTIYDEVDRTEGQALGDGFNDAAGSVWWWQAFRLQYTLFTLHTYRGSQTMPVPPDGIRQSLLPAGTY
jgi:hypothetical protein